MKKFLKFIGFIIIFLLILLVGLYFAIQKESVQNWLTQKVTSQLSKKIGTTIKVDHIKIDFLNHLLLQGVFIEDQKKDTLLYAGELQFNITDWFILKKEKPVIKFITLKDAIVNLNRPTKDSIWNYEFIAKAFTSQNNISSTNSITPNTANDTSIAFDLKEVNLQNVQFNYLDQWIGQNIILNIKDMALDANKIDWKQKWIDLDKLAFDNTKINFDEYDGGRGKRPKPDTIDTTPFNPYHWRITLNNLAFEESEFNYNKNFAKATPNVFDPNHIALKNLNINVNNLIVNNDTITAKINQIQTIDRCGFELKHTEALAKVSPISSRLDNLLIKTNNSTIQDYYEMQYSRFPDFEDYINKVIMKCSFNKSYIAMNDIGYFAPQVKNLTVKNVIINNGNAIGTVANLSATNLDIHVGKTYLLGDLSMKGLPDINTTFIELQAKNLQTSGNELITFVPQAKTNNVAWSKLSSINYKGLYKGYIADFITDGTLTTNLGTVKNKLHLTFPKNSQPTYDGFFASDNLQLGQIIKQDLIGTLSASGNIKGSGYDFNTIKTNFDGNIKSIQTKNYTYQNITINGELNNKTFDGKIDANDPAIAMNFDGLLDFRNSTPNFNLKTKLVRIDLKALGLSKDPMAGSAILDVDFSGTTLDNFSGNAKMYHLNLNTQDKKIYLDSAILTSRPVGNNKEIQLRSSAVDANLKGQFTIANLPKAMQYYLSNYLPNYIGRPKNITPQEFTFDIATKNIESIIKTFIPQVAGCNDATIVGNINMFNQQLNLNVNAPNFAWDKTSLENIVFNSTGNFDSLNLNGVTGKIFYNQKEVIPSATYNTTIGNDTAVAIITTAGGAYNVKNATLSAKGFAQKNKLFLNILPSDFYFNDSKWNLNTNEYVVFDSNRVAINNVTLVSGLQKILLKTEGIKQQNLIAQVENIDIQELLKFSETKYDLYGRVNGTIVLNEYLGDRAFSGQITTTDIKFNNDILGKLNLNVDYDNAKQLVSINKTSGLIYNGDKTEFYGTVNVKEKDPTLDLHAILNNTNLKTVENFFKDFISHTEGVANGTIDINGLASNYKLDGNITIENFKTKINYLGTSYNIPKGVVKMSETDIDLGRIDMFDELGNTAKLSGHIYHNRFADMRFGKEYGEQLPITVKSDKLMFLNTSADENDLYYGKVIAKGNMYIFGPLNNLEMEINATTLSNTNLTLPIKGDYDASTYDFIKFKTYGVEENITKNAKEKNRLKIRLGITATPDAVIRILLDPVTQEEIIGRGNSENLTMNIDLNNTMDMQGDFTITEGIYGYKFRGAIAKDLSIVPGGTIKWTGDPLKADLNLVATYNIKKANLAPLLGNITASAEDRINYPTNVLIQLSGEMLKPTIKYDITQPDNNNVTTQAYGKFMELKSNDQKMLSQVASLLLTNQFINTEATTSTTLTTSSILLTTVGGVVAPTLSNIISQQANKLFKTSDLQIDIVYQTSNNPNGSVDVFNYNIRKGFLNNRLTVEVGDNIDYVRGTSKTSYSALPSDFKMKYLIQPDGRLSLSLFSTTFTDIASTERASKIGLGLSYRKSFNNLNEIFKNQAITNYTNELIQNDTLK